MADGRLLRGAVVGLGFIGAGDDASGAAIGQNVAHLDGVHARAMANHPKIDLVAGVSSDSGRRNRFAAAYPGVRVYASLDEMLQKERPDIVSVATRAPAHAENVIACARAKTKAVLCEKPFVSALRDGDRAIAECGENGTLLAVNHSRRWHPLWNAVRAEIHSGALGSVFAASVCWASGRLGNVGTHFFDLLRMALGDEAAAVRGRVDASRLPDCRGEQYRDSGGSGVIEFRGGTRAYIDAMHDNKMPLRFRLIGALGELNATATGAELSFWSGEKRNVVPESSSGTSLDRAMANIVAALEGAEPLASTGEDGIAALEIITAFHLSGENNGAAVPLPLADRNYSLSIA